MKKITVYEVKAFSKGKTGGNPAGVVLEKTEDSMKQKIARKLGYSETVFLSRKQKDEFHLEFYTPNNQVDLCGHATIGAFTLLRELGEVEKGKYWQNGAAGRLKVVVDEKSVLMEQKVPSFHGRVGRKIIAESLNIEEEFLEVFPLEIVSTGLKDIIIPLKSLEILKNIEPDFEEIRRVSERYGVVGYHLFSMESIDGNTAFTRNFAPLYDIDEESATGTSNGALASYLKKYEITGKGKMVFEQGDFMEEPSRIEAIIEDGRVWVGGQGSLVKKYEIEI